MKQLAPLFLSLLLAAPAFAAETTRIGYVDIQAVLEQSKAGKKAQDTLKEKFAGRQQEFAKEEQELRALQQTLARDQALMSQAELDKRKGELQERARAFQEKAAKAQQELNEEQNKLGAAILEPAQKLIGEIAKEKKVSAIFERGQSGLLYIDDGLDLTADLIKKLDARK
jgi:outer membrane protein